jgi:hypothetical protein
MNHAISTINNLMAESKAQWAAQQAKLDAVSDGMKALSSGLGSMAAWSVAAFVVQLALLLFAPHAAQALLSFVRRRESPVLRCLGGAVACLVSPISTGFMLLGSAILRAYRSCCRGNGGGGEAPANPPPVSEVPRYQWSRSSCDQQYGGDEFLGVGVDSRGAGCIV